MAIQNINRGTAGNNSVTFKIGDALTTAQQNDDYLDLNKAGIINTWADIATTQASVGQVFILKQHTSGNIGGGTLVGVSGSVTDDGGTQKNSATSGVYLRRINYDVSTPKMFGAFGDGVSDDTASINKMLLSCIYCDFGPSENNYKISGALLLRNGHKIIGGFAKITQTATRTEIFNYEAKTNIEIYGIYFVGVGSDFNNSDSSRAVAIFGSGSEYNIIIENNIFYNFSYCAIRAKGASKVKCALNIIEGPGSAVLTPVTSGANYGILADTGCSDVVIESNTITKTAQGLRIEQSSDIRIANNKISNIVGQHGIYAGAALNNIQILGNKIETVDLIGIKVQNNDLNGADTVGVQIIGNIVRGCSDQGILVYNLDSNPTYKCRDVVISGNVVYSSANGIYVTSNYGCIISDNRIRSSSQSGIYYSESYDINIINNKINSTVESGIYDALSSTYVNISGNTIINPCSGAVAGNRYGIFIQGGSEYIIDSNKIHDSNAKMDHGIYVSGGTTSSMSLNRNIVPLSVAGGVRVPASAIFREYIGNVWSAANPSNNDPICPTVASATSTVLPQGYNVVIISGTTNITSIPANGHTNRIVCLIFQGALTVTDGSNLNLAGNFVTTANDTITLACDGSNWNEIARSVN